MERFGEAEFRIHKICSGRRNGTFVYLPGHHKFTTSLQVVALTSTDFAPSNLIGKRQITKNYFTGK